MAFTDRIAFDSITILEDGQMQVRRSRIIEENGVEVTRQYFRVVLVPGQDVTSYPTRVQALCNFIWTPQVIAAYRAAHPVGQLL